MPDMNQLFKNPALAEGLTKAPIAKEHGDSFDEAKPLGLFDDQELLALWERIKKESLEQRWVFEKQWHRNILYTLGRQWIEYYPRQGGWKDKRMAQWIPRPVTNKCKETVQSIRAMFTSIKLGINVRPNGSDPENVSAAATADELTPVLHEDHDMDSVFTEFDFWLLVTGNAFLHTFVDYDVKHGVVEDPTEECIACGMQSPSSKLAGAQPVCPQCGAAGAEYFQPALDEMGEPIVTKVPKGKPTTIPLSPLELAFPNSYARFNDLPYVVRLRWRTRTYYENHPILKDQVARISWQKSPADQSMQLFKSLSQYNDLGVSPAYLAEGTGGDSNEDGMPEYEVWYKPCEAYPDGLVFRVIGDSHPVVAHIDEEGLPGPLPYRDVTGKSLFTFAHAGYEHVGGRILASGPLDVIAQKQDLLNQLDSHVMLSFMRMSNPVWLKPKGAGITAMNGMPGLVIEWDSLTIGGNAKPERIPGLEIGMGAFKLREQYLQDIEELAGTFDIIKGAKPTGVEAFSALQLLVERSQSRFAGVFSSRGNAYRQWFKFAIELEREFGPDERTKAILTPARTWTFQNFKRAQLNGSISIVVEDGSNAPKTSLGMRAALEHGNQLGMLDMKDPDQKYEGLKLIGLTKIVPSLDIHVQSALQKQQAFEQWVNDPAAQQQSMQMAEQQTMQYEQSLEGIEDPMMFPPPPSQLASTPLKWKKWYNPSIHRQEFIKWANSDRMRQLLTERPELEALLEIHLVEIDQALIVEAQQQAMQQGAAMPVQPAPAGGAMAGSNRESTQGNEPKGSSEGNQNQGPA